MEKKKENGREEKHKKFLLVLPLLVLPFLTMAFWVLGGGKGKERGGIEELSGFNPELPSAKVDEKKLDKLAFYNQAERDSLKWLEKAKQDPYYTEESNDLYGYNPAFNPYSMDAGDYDSPSTTNHGYADPNEQKVYDKLRQLDMVLENAKASDNADYTTSVPEREATNIREDVDRLEQMMQLMQGAQHEDPEMQQINSVLESILDIQHPERVQDRLRQSSNENRGQVFAVAAYQKQTPITLLDNKSTREYAEKYQVNPQRRDNRFFGMDDYALGDDGDYSIEAVVHETQTLVTGSTVKLRLLNDVFINGRLIPKDNFVFGTASLRGERLEVGIESIRLDNALFPVKLSVHDMDGLAGIYIPGAISRDVAKQSGDQAIQGMSFGTMSPSLGVQAASAGIELGRNLLSRKIKLVKVEVKAGYKVLLKDGKKREF